MDQAGSFLRARVGAGNIGLDNAAAMRAVVKTGYDGWVFVEHDTHPQDPLKDLAISHQYLRDAGFQSESQLDQEEQGGSQQ